MSEPMATCATPLLVSPEEARLTPAWVWSSELGDLLAELRSTHRDLRPSGLAVVVLDKEPLEYAATNDVAEFPGASLLKLAALYAAYQLRCDVRHVAADLPPRDLALGTVADRLRASWQAAKSDVVKPLAAPSAPKPELGIILELRRESASSTVVFQGQAVLDDERLTELDAIHSRIVKLPELKQKQRLLKALRESTKPHTGVLGRERVTFYEMLWLMARWSNNGAAAVVIGAVGLPYIAALMLQTGLWRERWAAPPGSGPGEDGDAGGLWLTNTYAPDHIALGPFPPGHSEFVQSATARSLAAFMTLLHRGRLVDRESSDDMMAILDKSRAPTGIASPFSTFLNKVRDATVLSKVGILGAGTRERRGECAVVLPATRPIPASKRYEGDLGPELRQEANKLTYVAVMLDTRSFKARPTHFGVFLGEVDRFLATARTKP